MRSCTYIYIYDNTAHDRSLSHPHHPIPWAYHTEAMPLPLPTSSRLPKSPCTSIYSHTAYSNSLSHPHPLRLIAVPAIHLFTPSQINLKGRMLSWLYAHSNATITCDLEIESTHGQPTSCRAPLLAFEHTQPSHIYLPLLSHPRRPVPSHRVIGEWRSMAMTTVEINTTVLSCTECVVHT